MARNRSTARASLLTERLFSFWVILLVSFPQSSYNSKRCFFTQALAQSFDSRRVSIVTGGNGYIGREIVQVLLQQQQEDQPEPVFCLVREKRVASEKEYWNNNDSVTVFPYDMLDGGETLTQALQHACQNDKDAEVCIYHVASVFGPSDNHVQTAKDNVKGTEDLVKAVAKFHHSGTTNCRLVVTSSMAAVRGSGQTPKNGKYYTHEDWNTISQLDDKNWGSCYQWSKAESEKRAWELAKEHNFPMSSICPSFVFGPPTSTNQQLSGSYSITLVGQWVRGESPVQSRLCVDIRDVARAHVAASNAAMGERFIVSTEARIPSQNIANALKRICNQETELEGDASKITFDSNFQGGAIPIGQQEVEATERLEQKLGITLRPVEETMSDMGRSLLQAAKASKEIQAAKN